MVKQVAMDLMPILATGKPFITMRQQGFTLIELLVVVLIIGLFAGVVVMNLQPNNSVDKQLSYQTKRLYQRLQLAQDEAIMQGIEIGLHWSPTEYYFSSLQQDKWLPLTADPQLNAHKLPEGLVMRLVIENVDVSGEDMNSEDDETVAVEAKIPTVMLLSSGEVTAFQLLFAPDLGGEEEFEITAQANGVLAWRDIAADIY